MGLPREEAALLEPGIGGWEDLRERPPPAPLMLPGRKSGLVTFIIARSLGLNTRPVHLFKYQGKNSKGWRSASSSHGSIYIDLYIETNKLKSLPHFRTDMH
jgi:hypothetical protein